MKKAVLISISILWNVMAIDAQNVASFKISFDEDKVVLPISYRSGANPVIEVQLNGKGPYKFMFDTGSPIVAKLDEKVFNELNLSVTDSVLAGDGSGANSKSFPVTNLKEISIGTYHIKNVDAMVRNYNQRKNIDVIDGVIGLSFFKGVLVELNFETNQLIISKGKLDKEDKSAFAMSTENDVPRIKLKLGSKELPAILDTGNMGWLTVHSSDITNEMILGTPKVVGRAKTVSNEFEIREAELNQAIAIGSIEFQNPTIIINDVLPQSNAGIRFLRQMNITFDMKNNLVRLVRFQPKLSETNSKNDNEYTGKYGDRTITANDEGTLFIQRPNGMLMKMVARSKDGFGLEMVPNAAIVFERDSNNKIIAVKVSKGDGVWERSAKD
ncbi:retropepsin-like aspartic protease [Flavobacterium wongokense]|uniref:retropepsin-like aspartic protease n=1 Tax=Flavobacterium wongokense TaxID=2910674 RepID=UPI001F1B770C|nr:retropepsin-like aspartic protease [Flavobacterium sp. WG47]MCF6130804.1 retroviral-like aspartic protease family protein [Flavobacterium sp. WG47]